MNLSDIKHLFSYTEWANNLATDAAGRLSDESLRCDVGISHKSIFGMANAGEGAVRAVELTSSSHRGKERSVVPD